MACYLIASPPDANPLKHAVSKPELWVFVLLIREMMNFGFKYAGLMLCHTSKQRKYIYPAHKNATAQGDVFGVHLGIYLAMQRMDQ